MSKVIFAGTTDFGIPALEVLKRDFDLALVITQPDRPVGKKRIITPPPVKVWAQENGIRFLQPESISDIEPQIAAVGADAMIVAAYGQIIPKRILDLPKKGSLNLHSSLLPKYRGASPIHAAILNDDMETGVTLMLMDEKLDHGPVLAHGKIYIDETDDFASLHKKLSDVAGHVLSKHLKAWISGEIAPRTQRHEEASYVKTFSRADARIDWTKPARQILQMIKAYNPEPGTWTTLDKKSVKILKAEEHRSGRIDLPGKIYSEGKDCYVKCGDYSLKLLMVQPEGKNPFSGRDFINGLKNLETKVFV